MLIRTILSIASRCVFSSFHLICSILKGYHRFGMAVFSPWLPFKVSVFVSSLGMVVLRVLFHQLVPQTSASSTHPGSITSPSISVTVGSSINALNFYVPAGSLLRLIGLRRRSLSTVSTLSTSSHCRGKHPYMTSITQSFTRPTTLSFTRQL
jgi:hypothetical protein